MKWLRAVLFSSLVKGLQFPAQTARVTCRQVVLQSWQYTRAYTSNGGSSENSCVDQQDEVEHYRGPVPRDKLIISYSRSGGPGGQNVNKVNTKAHVRFHLDSADWIPERVKEKVKELFASKITKNGELLISSQLTRSQLLNTEDAIRKIDSMLSEASEVRQGPSELTLARRKLLKREAQMRRRAEKKYQAMKKQSRQFDDKSDDF